MTYNIYQYNKKNKEGSRNTKITSLLKKSVSNFIYEKMFVPITLSRAFVTNDLSKARFFFVLPITNIKYGNNASFKDVILDLLFKERCPIENIDKSISDESLFLVYLNCIKPTIRWHIAKSVKLKKIPEISFFIEKDDVYIANNF